MGTARGAWHLATSGTLQTILSSLHHNNIQWDVSNLDTNGTAENVHFSELSLICNSGIYLGWEKVSSLERYLQIRGVLIDITILTLSESGGWMMA